MKHICGIGPPRRKECGKEFDSLTELLRHIRIDHQRCQYDRPHYITTERLYQQAKKLKL